MHWSCATEAHGKALKVKLSRISLILKNVVNPEDTSYTINASKTFCSFEDKHIQYADLRPGLHSCFVAKIVRHHLVRVSLVLLSNANIPLVPHTDEVKELRWYEQIRLSFFE